ncbi:hypothetical protein NC652_017350 [Populus alba x Populus x berolinensis]|uniref:Uncharacterized protein n=1 Tax=Populus alba x Populus x berolinensis TaxID=444605 RepID=A0AAD6QQ06_9ROSI|nr:hypothetical protein NC652_017350 [Populus alba x Populus x berolinensis]KAJ6994374.1 hypothetical protein NC653_017256 [Populus alba x Populus x berolinensis]
MTTLSHAFSGCPLWSRRLFCRRLSLKASVGNKASKQDKSSGPGRDPLYAIVGVAHHINRSSDFISPPASGVNKEEQHSGPSS